MTEIYNYLDLHQTLDYVGLAHVEGWTGLESFKLHSWKSEHNFTDEEKVRFLKASELLYHYFVSGTFKARYSNRIVPLDKIDSTFQSKEREMISEEDWKNLGIDFLHYSLHYFERDTRYDVIAMEVTSVNEVKYFLTEHNLYEFSKLITCSSFSDSIALRIMPGAKLLEFGEVSQYLKRKFNLNQATVKYIATNYNIFGLYPFHNRQSIYIGTLRPESAALLSDISRKSGSGVQIIDNGNNFDANWYNYSFLAANIDQFDSPPKNLLTYKEVVTNLTKLGLDNIEIKDCLESWVSNPGSELAVKSDGETYYKNFFKNPIDLEELYYVPEKLDELIENRFGELPSITMGKARRLIKQFLEHNSAEIKKQKINATKTLEMFLSEHPELGTVILTPDYRAFRDNYDKIIGTGVNGRGRPKGSKKTKVAA